MAIADITTKEAAKLLGVSERTIVYWVAHGHFPAAYKLNPFRRNSPIRIPQTDIDRILSIRKTPAH